MRVEDRTGVMKSAGDKTSNVILICEEEWESKIIDKLGNIGDQVRGELHLSDGYGAFYIRLEPMKLERSVFTKEVSRFIQENYGDISARNHHTVFNYLITAISKLVIADDLNEKFVSAINLAIEAIDLMDYGSAMEILQKAVT